jgi:hypothetical protein
MTDIYVTKYALTSGISRFTLDKMFNEDTVVVHSLGGMNRTEMHHRPDWHLTLDEAMARAKSMRHSKLISLANQIEKMKKLNFDDSPVLDMRWDGKTAV